MINNFDIFLFDFDGLLVDTEIIHFQAYKNMLLKWGFKLNWSFSKYCSIAHTSKDGIKNNIYSEYKELLNKQPNWDVLYKDKKNIYFDLLTHSKIKLMKGAKGLLTFLKDKNKKRAVVTHSLKSQVDIIRKCDPILDSIPNWFTREDYDKPKPFSDGYNKAISNLFEKGDKVIGFEDTLKGLESLSKTIAKPILICNKDHPQLDMNLPENTSHFESLEDFYKNYI